MNPEQLWDTTVNPETRRLLQVKIEDAVAAGRHLQHADGRRGELRRELIEDNAGRSPTLDVEGAVRGSSARLAHPALAAPPAPLLPPAFAAAHCLRHVGAVGSPKREPIEDNALEGRQPRRGEGGRASR